MRAAVVESVPGRAEICEVELDTPGIGEVVIRTVASGVCHSDIHALHGHGAVFPTPFVLGHEPAGIVEAIGPGVKHVQPGDHVVACLSVYCGHCANCLTGKRTGASSTTTHVPPTLRPGSVAATRPCTSSWA